MDEEVEWTMERLVEVRCVIELSYTQALQGRYWGMGLETLLVLIHGINHCGGVLYIRHTHKFPRRHVVGGVLDMWADL